MTHTPQEPDSSKRSRKSPSRRNPTAPRAWVAGIPEADIEIRIAEGADSERLADQQPRTLWEVTKWQLGQNNSENGTKCDSKESVPKGQHGYSASTHTSGRR